MSLGLYGPGWLRDEETGKPIIHPNTGLRQEGDIVRYGSIDPKFRLTLHNRFGAWVAAAAGIDLSGAEPHRSAVGGFVTTARATPVQLTIGDVVWEPPVWFCDPWPLSFHLLGQEGFFRWFDVRLRAARFTVEITAEG
jgi:hypothetical protein